MQDSDPVPAPKILTLEGSTKVQTAKSQVITVLFCFAVLRIELALCTELHSPARLAKLPRLSSHLVILLLQPSEVLRSQAHAAIPGFKSFKSD